MLLNRIQILSAALLASSPLVPLVFHQAGQAQMPEPEAIAIQFASRVGDMPFSCGSSYPGLGTANTTVAATDFRFYVSDVALIDASGRVVPLVLEQDGKWQYQNVALLDFEDGTGACVNGTSETRTQVTGTVPPGNYTGVMFTLGVPFDLNHNDATLAPSPLNLTALWWNWQGGYKFARIDLENQAMVSSAGLRQHNGDQPHNQPHGNSHDDHLGPHGDSQGFLIHLGSTGCELEGDNQQPTTSCRYPNTSTLVFMDFDPVNQFVVADLAALVADSNLEQNEPDTPLGCMSSPDDGDCAGILHNFGIPHGDQPPGGQTFFRIE
ncbi:MAG: MbnP family copper-binding protein [Synechococcales bacterium]|nr:MbnP family copper-binding protein [Synechococcales bacterium]